MTQIKTGKDGKYHFLYSTVNKISGRIYLGKHTTKNINDSYLGSGKEFKKDVNLLGKRNFERTILSFFDSKELLNKAERILITSNIVKDENYYNAFVGGFGGDLSHFYKNGNNPTKNAIKSATTLKNRLDVLKIRNEKISIASKNNFINNPIQLLNRCFEMNKKMRGATKENSDSIRLQIKNRKDNHFIKMKSLYLSFCDIYQHNKNIKEIVQALNISSCTAYRFANAFKNNSVKYLIQEDN